MNPSQSTRYPALHPTFFSARGVHLAAGADAAVARGPRPPGAAAGLPRPLLPRPLPRLQLLRQQRGRRLHPPPLAQRHHGPLTHAPRLLHLHRLRVRGTGNQFNREKKLASVLA